MRDIIEGEKIVLRKYEINFAPLLFEAASESRGGEFARWMPWCHENYSLAESRSFIQGSIETWKTGKIYNYAIFEQKSGDFVGGIGLNQFSLLHKFFNLGYWVRVSRHNQAIASTATRLLARASFQSLPVNRLEIIAAVKNEASHKAAEKAGATREGILRKRLLIGDQVHDAVIFSFIREDFDLQLYS